MSFAKGGVVLLQTKKTIYFSLGVMSRQETVRYPPHNREGPGNCSVSKWIQIGAATLGMDIKRQNSLFFLTIYLVGYKKYD